MEESFKNRLEEFLQSELWDYSLPYTLEDEEDMIKVNISDQYWDWYIQLEFTYDEEKDELILCMYEENYEVVEEFSRTVKYFWMKIAPVFFK